MVDILQRLTVKDLVNYRSVSKQWLSIIDNPDFIRSQLHGSLSTNSPNSILFIKDRESGNVVSLKKQSHADISSSSFFSSDPTQYGPTRNLELIGSCHGLLCFSLLNRSQDFVILNPSTGERRELASKPSQEGDRLHAFGFGYDELSDDYKVLRILRTTSASDPDINPSYIAEIYGVRSKGFFATITLPASNWTNSCLRKSMGVFFGSSLHWCTCIQYNTDGHAMHSIDIVSNTYRRLHLPETTFGRIWWLNVGIVDNRLCLSGALRGNGEIGVWVMEEYGNSESWNRIYCFQNEGGLINVNPVGSDGDKILLMLNMHTFFWCDPTKKSLDEITFNMGGTNSRWKTYEVVFCLESLVKIFSNNVKKRCLVLP
ncbi:F-box protein CPR1 [Linum grandiflorum]